ncbi:hypothetical protein [Leisingera sp. JC11]|uniref:hypothetical protein n=1 Tax=Leisingera sp. JC11 TaxID=3042469 RepID=UPI003456EE30
MTAEERIAELEQQLTEARRAAVAIILGITDAIATTPEGREELAQGFDEAAGQGSKEMRALSRLVATALRDKV